MGKRNRVKDAQKRGKGKGGRPRKSGARFPGGKLRPQAEAQAESVVGSSAVSPTMVHRMREHGRTLGLDPRLGTTVGVLLLREQLSAFEAAAAFKVADIYRRFEREQGCRRFTRSPSYEIGFQRAMAAEGSDDGQEPLIALQKALIKFGYRACFAVETLCVDDQPIGPAQLYEVKAILAYLGKEHFKMHAAVLAGGPQQQQKPPRIGARAAKSMAATARAASTGPAKRDKAEILATMLRDVMPADEVSEVLAFARAVHDRRRFEQERQGDDGAPRVLRNHRSFSGMS